MIGSKDQKQTTNPGPGQYTRRDVPHEDAPKWSMGTSSRADLSPKREVPGPGSYKLDLKVHLE